MLAGHVPALQCSRSRFQARKMQRTEFKESEVRKMRGFKNLVPGAPIIVLVLFLIFFMFMFILIAISISILIKTTIADRLIDVVTTCPNCCTAILKTCSKEEAESTYCPICGTRMKCTIL